MLEAMADERLQNIGVQLIIAGEFYESADQYYNIIEKHNLKNRVVLHTDFIPNDRVKYYFGAADLVVQPYRSATQSGISQLAFHFEKPMVVTRVGGLPEIVQHGEEGYVVDIDPQAIADAVVDFYENNRGSKLQEGMRAGKQRYQWSAMVSGIQELFKKLNNG